MLFHVEQRREKKFGTEPKRALIHHLGTVFSGQVILLPEETYSPFNTLCENYIFIVYVWPRFSLHFKKIVTNWINRHWFFSKARKRYCCCLVSKSPPNLVISWTKAPLSMGFPRQEYWSGLPFSSPRKAYTHW